MYLKYISVEFLKNFYPEFVNVQLLVCHIFPGPVFSEHHTRFYSDLNFFISLWPHFINLYPSRYPAEGGILNYYFDIPHQCFASFLFFFNSNEVQLILMMHDVQLTTLAARLNPQITPLIGSSQWLHNLTGKTFRRAVKEHPTDLPGFCFLLTPWHWH